MKKTGLALWLALCLMLPGLALGATGTFEGTVVSSESISITAPFGGTVSAFSLREGDAVTVGDPIATVNTTKVYASTSGEVTGVFGQPGDAVEDVVSRFGAVLYLVPDSRYTVTADIQYAYNDSDNRYVHIGETVYLHSYSSSYDHSAVGTITGASGTTFTVETTQGELMMQETVAVYRDSAYTAKSRIGRGTVSRTAEVAVGASSASSASGTASSENSILYLHVADGDRVERGQLLYETVTGTLDGLYATSNQIVATQSGVVASVNVSAGSTLNKGDTLLTLYPRDRMQVQVELDEYDLEEIAEGDVLTLTFHYDDSATTQTTGTVAMISHVSESTDTTDVMYLAYLDFTPTEQVRLGMTVSATLLSSASDIAQPEPQEPAQETQEAVTQ